MEANAILHTEHDVRNLGAYARTNKARPKYANAEYVRIAHLYVKMYVLISHALDACGLHGMTVSINNNSPLIPQLIK